MPVTTILETRYVLRNKLNTLLQEVFGQNYKVKVDGDQIEITASRKLNQAEIDAVTWTE